MYIGLLLLTFLIIYYVYMGRTFLSLLKFYFIIYMHLLILFITMCLFILLKVSITKIKKEGAQNIIFDLKRYY